MTAHRELRAISILLALSAGVCAQFATVSGSLFLTRTQPNFVVARSLNWDCKPHLAIANCAGNAPNADV